jgi:hypothetical protein
MDAELSREDGGGSFPEISGMWGPPVSGPLLTSHLSDADEPGGCLAGCVSCLGHKPCTLLDTLAVGRNLNLMWWMLQAQ